MQTEDESKLDKDIAHLSFIIHGLNLFLTGWIMHFAFLI